MVTNKKLNEHSNYFSMEGGMHEMFTAKEEITKVLAKRTLLSLINKKDRRTLLTNMEKWFRGLNVFITTGGAMCPYGLKKAVGLFAEIHKRCWYDNYLRDHIQRGVYHNLRVVL